MSAKTKIASKNFASKRHSTAHSNAMFHKKFIKRLEKNLNRTKGLVGLARKAGYVIIGRDNLVKYTKKLYLLIVDKTAGSSLLREMRFLSENRNLPLLEVENLADLVGIENCKAVGVKNKAMSESIEKSVKGE